MNEFNILKIINNLNFDWGSMWKVQSKFPISHTQNLGMRFGSRGASFFVTNLQARNEIIFY